MSCDGRNMRRRLPCFIEYDMRNEQLYGKVAMPSMKVCRIISLTMSLTSRKSPWSLKPSPRCVSRVKTVCLKQKATLVFPFYPLELYRSSVCKDFATVIAPGLLTICPAAHTLQTKMRVDRVALKIHLSRLLSLEWVRVILLSID